MGASHTSQPPPGTRCPTLGPWHTRSLCRRVCPPQALSPAWPAQPEWHLLRGPLPAAWSHSSQLVAQFEVMSFCLCFFSLLLSPPGWTESPQESSVLALHGVDGAHQAKLGSTAGRSRASSGTRNTRPQTGRAGAWRPHFICITKRLAVPRGEIAGNLLLRLHNKSNCPVPRCSRSRLLCWELGAVRGQPQELFPSTGRSRAPLPPRLTKATLWG